jgi:hypothetical protein
MAASDRAKGLRAKLALKLHEAPNDGRASAVIIDDSNGVRRSAMA